MTTWFGLNSKKNNLEFHKIYFLATCYLSPSPEKNSSRISNLSDDGDLNAWTGIEKDSAQIDKYDEQFDLTIKEPPPPPRETRNTKQPIKEVWILSTCSYLLT